MGVYTDHILRIDIFLSAERMSQCRLYPKAILGDLGLATDVRRLRPGARGGTEGFIAPEVENSLLDYDVTHKADIWGVGMIIWHLMFPHTEKKSNKIRWDPNGSRSRPHEWGAAELRMAAVRNFNIIDGDTFPQGTGVISNRHVYSHRLHELVRRCLRTNPDERPDFHELRWKVQKELKAMEIAYGKKFVTEAEVPTDDPLHVFLVPNEFPIGGRTRFRKRPRDGDGDGGGGGGDDDDDDDDDDDSDDDSDGYGRAGRNIGANISVSS
jgi:serine/threonine protein kinase